jgi:phosphoglycerate dehydrogenase-like enzyme
MESDIVTLHVPLSPETRGFIGRRELEEMKNTAILINTSRGAVVDEIALYEALRDGGISGAGLDVLQREPMTTDNPLKNMNNVIVTPHAASNTLDSRLQCASFAYGNIKRILYGEEPLARISA